MQKKLEKLEEKINSLLTVIGVWLVTLAHKIIPQKFFDKIEQTKIDSKNWWSLKKEQLKDLSIKLLHKLIEFKDVLLIFIDKLQNLPIKEKIGNFKDKIKDVIFNTPLKSHAQWIINKFKFVGERFSFLVHKVGKQQLSIAVTALIMIGAGVLGIYDSSKKIYNKEFLVRAPASVQEYDQKPDYYMYLRKTATILKVEVPIYGEDVNDVRRITIDFTVRTSTRFAKKYLEFHTQKLKDYFFTTVEPVTSDFPLEEEGKQVLKEKIHHEVNNFLIREKVEGRVEEVYLIYSMGY